MHRNVTGISGFAPFELRTTCPYENNYFAFPETARIHVNQTRTQYLRIDNQIRHATSLAKPTVTCLIMIFTILSDFATRHLYLRFVKFV